MDSGDSDDGELVEVGFCGWCSGCCFAWMARMRVSMSVLKTGGLVSSELSSELEYSGGDPNTVLS